MSIWQSNPIAVDGMTVDVRATVVRSRVPMCERDDWGFHTVYRDLVQLGSGALEFRAPIDGADHAEGRA